MSRPNIDELERQLEQSELKRARLQKRLAEKHIEEDSLEWSLTDLMMLLVIFFLLFFSDAVHSTTAAEPARTATENADVEAPAPKAQKEDLRMVDQLVREAAARQVEPAPAKAAPEPARAAPPEQPAGDEKSDARLEDLRARVLSELKQDMGDDLTVRMDNRRLVLVLGERVTFGAGRAEILDDFGPALEKIAALIHPMEKYEVEVAGHTDNTPINTAQFPSNWELSAARASAVARFLVDSGVRAGQVSVKGYSEFRPVFPNDSPEHKQGNRRVEITLIRSGNS